MTMPAGLTDFDSASPWTPGDQLLGSVTAQVIAAGASAAFDSNYFARSSYLIATDALYGSSASVPLPIFDMEWVDPTSGLVLAHERWVINGTSTSPASSNSPITGRGPSKSAQLNITVTNPDPLVSCSLDLALYQSSRAITRDDWRSLGMGAIPGYTNAASDCPMLIPGFKASANLNAGTSVSRVIGLYAGPAEFAVTQSAGQTLQWLVTALDSNQNLANPIIVDTGTSTSDFFQAGLTLPRCPCLITIENNGSSATTVGFAVTAQELTS